MIDLKASVFKLQMDSAIAVPAFVQLIDLADFGFNGAMFILLSEFFKMIVKCAPCHLSMLEKLS
jgi:hypothetical protein